jgi:hypothetical protein
MTENERFGLVFVKTGSLNSGTGRAHHSLKTKDNIMNNIEILFSYLDFIFGGILLQLFPATVSNGK